MYDLNPLQHFVLLESRFTVCKVLGSHSCADKNQVFSDVTPCWLENGYRRSGGVCSLHLQGLSVRDTKDGGSMLLQNVSNYLPVNIV